MRWGFLLAATQPAQTTPCASGSSPTVREGSRSQMKCLNYSLFAA